MTFARFIPACAGNGPPAHLEAGRFPVHPRVRGERLALWEQHQNDLGSSPRARGTDRPVPPAPGQHRFIPACAGNGSPASARCRAAAVHPRVRGERSHAPGSKQAPSGSSPRARGTGVHGHDAAEVDRFIPACAGNGARWPRPAGPRAVHPRVRGERSLRSSSSRAACGSSPRARGTVPQGLAAFVQRRFIPACAGNGSTPTAPAEATAVHPRVRGERKGSDDQADCSFGSSPRARGTGTACGPPGRSARFIPACAGNGMAGSGDPAAGTVHPRVRGERDQPGLLARADAGSSPRARGTGKPRFDGVVPIRFIPACAGNGRRGWRRVLAGPVHPRVRGERAQSLALEGDMGGSSPRARGTAPAAQDAKNGTRFIPACAGNGSRAVVGSASAPVHPRVRGERIVALLRSWPEGGSSPRARGTDLVHAHQDDRDRFIPACAGNGLP